jgi:hypothetical protein
MLGTEAAMACPVLQCCRQAESETGAAAGVCVIINPLGAATRISALSAAAAGQKAESTESLNNPDPTIRLQDLLHCALPMSELLTQMPGQKATKLMAAALALLALFLAAFIYLASHWPFRREAVVKELEDESLSKVNVGRFHQTYFPRPGCVLEHVVFQHNLEAGVPPLITVERIRIEGSFAGLLTHHVRHVLAEGMHIFVPPRGTNERFETMQRSTIVIDELDANGAILEVASSQHDKQPLNFVFHEFRLSHVGSPGPASFKARLSNPEPPGEITTTGNFGPWRANNVGQTAVSGEYLFQRADLGAFHGIGGTLSSSGKFAGSLDRIGVEGATDVPLFAVTLSSHQVHLQAQFHAVVNSENGDTFLQRVTATFRKTTVWTEGSVAGTAGQAGKTAVLELAAKEGRIQDVLLLFAKAPSAPMSGIVSFEASVSIPPGPRPFLEKVELKGDFGIDVGSFTKFDTQKGVNSLSTGARGEEDHHKKDSDKDEIDPETVLSDLKGHVVLKDGTVRFSNLTFSVPGALAQMWGTYSLITEKIDLRGNLKTDAAVSKTTHGIRALMLKVVDPFLRKKHGYVAPVKITGTYEHPSFGLDLSDQDHHKDLTVKTHASRVPGHLNHWR